MSAPKHTPGPWVVTEDSGAGRPRLRVVCASEEFPVRTKGLRVAELDVGWSSRSRDDAALIAAAPELLEALERAQATLHHMGDALNEMDAVLEEDEAHFDTFEIVGAALKKARGE